MRKIANYLMLTAVALLMSACASQRLEGLRLSADKAIDISSYERFSLQSPEVLSPEINEFFDLLLQKKFEAKGLAYDAQHADLLVIYQLMTLERERVELNTVVQDGVTQTRPEYVAEFYGGIALQLVDAETGRVLWKALAGRDTTQTKTKLDIEQINRDLDVILAPVQRE